MRIVLKLYILKNKEKCFSLLSLRPKKKQRNTKLFSALKKSGKENLPKNKHHFCFLGYSSGNSHISFLF